MNNIEQSIYDDIITIIKDNLQLLIYNHDNCLYRFNKYCNEMYDTDEKKRINLDQSLLAIFTEEALYSLLNADFLYDLRDLE